MSDPAYFTDNGHLLLTGVTGAQGDYLGESGQFGGKSALATWWADNPGRSRDLVIFLNAKSDDVGAVLDDFDEVNRVGDIPDVMDRSGGRVILTPVDGDWEAVSRRLESFVRALPQDMTKLVVLDEAPELDEDAVLSFVRVHGNGANCKTLVIAQSPTDISTKIAKQCVPVWVGPMKNDYGSWFAVHDIKEAFDFISAAHAPYHWTVIIGKAAGEWHHYEPVPAKYGEV
ncbi:MULTISPECIES: hypothetical protein [unclassified Haloferax]|uniref:hypothetical protein n=1 Tax=unclassified Haloferax TaxID=2625095 RepID=UPI0028750CFB|nr:MULTISPECIES: hypothetical protein [unclassified Haloferax]MDS0243945.1 hypothetical protein [Haloferax sp. S2CR25]MDS0447066.1 hypothetical protein [Haloferax sp. S2CR25-2]